MGTNVDLLYSHKELTTCGDKLLKPCKSGVIHLSISKREQVKFKQLQHVIQPKRYWNISKVIVSSAILNYSKEDFRVSVIYGNLWVPLWYHQPTVIQTVKAINSDHQIAEYVKAKETQGW